MKTKMILLATIVTLITMNTFGAILTVSNDPAGGSQYSSLQSAYNAATNGDTLMLEGTNNAYFLSHCGYWEKSLTVIGIGINPQKQNPKRTIIRQNDCFYYTELGAGAAGSKFYGIEFTTWVRTRAYVPNLNFEHCKFNVGFTFYGNTGSNVAFTDCIFDNNNSINLYVEGTGNVVSNVLVRNCVFDGYVEGNGNPYVTMLIDHCLFLDGSFSNLYYTTVSNCVFMNTFPSGIGNSTFLNNICRVAGTFPPAGLGGNVGSGNISNTNPNFVNYTLGSFWSTAHDYHLQAGSAAIGAASDATDIGLHGGSGFFSEQLEVLITPIMRQVMINNPTVSPNGTLNVQINATKPDDN
jgi:hypothetical protein